MRIFLLSLFPEERRSRSGHEFHGAMGGYIRGVVSRIIVGFLTSLASFCWALTSPCARRLPECWSYLFFGRLSPV